MRKLASPTPSLGALALGFAAALAAAVPAARADGGSDGLGTDALVSAVPHQAGGWSNGTAALIAKGGGKYSLSYAGATTGDVGVHGSITLAKALLEQRLVDELCLSVGRVLDPVGRRLFDSVAGLEEMELLEAAPTSTGSLWLRYRLRR